jgi:CRISPR-associated protein Csb2
MLAIKVEYLTGVCMATRHDDPSRSTPEWPPHPDRLYSALVAAAAEPTSGNGSHVPETACDALRWLAQQGAPRLAVSEARRRSAPDVHVPTNPHEDEVWQKPKKGKPRAPQQSFDLRTLLPVRRKKAVLPIPAVVPDEPVAYFIWPKAEPAGLQQALHDICSRVTCLGRSRSLVRVSLVDDPPPATHVLDAIGEVQLRVPGPDRLGYLIEKYKRDGGHPAPCPTQRYRLVEHALRRPELLQSVFDRFWVLRPQRGDPLLPAVSTVKVTQALRKALIACIEEDQRDRGIEPKVPDIVHGHGRHPHCAYVALPFVHPWQRHADGAIKGLAVLLPRGVDDDGLMALANGLMRLQNRGLGIPGIGTWRLEEAPADDPPNATLDCRTWMGIVGRDGNHRPARIWATATPMVFGHFPKANKGGEAKVVLDSLAMVGIEPDRVLEIAVGRHSPLHGAPPSWCFKPRRGDGETNQPPAWVRHVTLSFDRPVYGPIVLGCKRYFGLGLMRPLEE